MSIINRHKTIALILSLFTIATVVTYNLYTFVLAPPPAPAHPNAYLGTDGQPISSPPTPQLISTLPSWLPLAISGTLLGTAVIGFFLLAHYLDQQRGKRDTRRRKDLSNLVDALQIYYGQNSHYPISSTYAPQYYTAINLSNDWHYYGLPTDDEMRQYLPAWPISDPSLDYHGSVQMNQYIYFPRSNGQAFDLYAHLETPLPNAPDYNRQDNLPLAWGHYNYKVSGMPLPAPAVDKPIVTEETPNPVPATGNPPVLSHVEEQPSPPQPSPPISGTLSDQELEHINQLLNAQISTLPAPSPTASGNTASANATEPTVSSITEPNPNSGTFALPTSTASTQSQLDALAAAVQNKLTLDAPADPPGPPPLFPDKATS